MTTNLEQICAEVYRQVYHLWLGLENVLPTWDHKFSILYGPPVEQPPFFVIGFNPGGGGEQDTEETWDDDFWYATATRPLCLILQSIFKKAGHFEGFERSTGANLLFFRTPGIQRRVDGTGWLDVPGELRNLLEAYCRTQLDRMIDAMQPNVLVVMGWDAYRDLKDMSAPEQVLEQNGQWLAVQTLSRGRPMIAIKHPSARARSRWTETQIEQAGNWLSARLPRLLTSA
jgi:hypothetical protein